MLIKFISEHPNRRTSQQPRKDSIRRALTGFALVLLGFTHSLPASASASIQCPALFTEEAIELKTRPKPFDPSRRYDAETLSQRLFAVHATEYMPVNGVISVGGDPKPRFLPTLHFSLGEVVRPHSLAKAWEAMPYAVITTLKSLEPQLVNLMPYDTYILGDFKLPPDAILVLPQGREHLAPAGIRIAAYDAQNTSLRAAVDQVIQDEGGWPVRGLSDAGTMFHPTTINGWNINTREFFQPVLDRNPGVSYGQHVEAEYGTGASFGALDVWLRGIFLRLERGDAFQIQTETLRFELGLAMAHQKILKQEIKKRNFPPAALKAFSEANARLDGWLNIAELELRLREKSGKSLFALSFNDKEKKSHFLKRRALKPELDTYAQAHLDELPTFAEPGSDLSANGKAKYLAQSLQHFPPKERDALLAKYPGIAREATPILNDLLYNMTRTMKLSLQQAKQEGLLDAIERAATELEKAGTHPKRHEIVQTFHAYLTPYMNREFKRMRSVLAIIELPSVRALLNSELSFRLPNRTPLTFDDYLRANPEVAQAFEPLPSPPRDPDVLALMKAISKDLSPAAAPRPPYTSLSAASKAASFVSTYKEKLAVLPELEQKPADVVLKKKILRSKRHGARADQANAAHAP
jgi:hypothetical protein